MKKYKKLHDKKKISIIGFGMYKGAENKEGDEKWLKSLLYGLKKGINLIDTAQKYRNGKSEKILGKAIKIYQKKNKREYLTIISKVGLLPKYFYTQNLQTKIGIKKNNINNALNFCIDTKYINWSIDNSLKLLEIKYLDYYLLHNPEIALLKTGGYKKILNALDTLQTLKENGKIKYYGIATWNGLRRSSSSKMHINLLKIITYLNKKYGKKNGFKCIEAPLSIGMTDVYHYRSNFKKENMSLIELLKKFNINFFSSASLYEGKIQELVNLNRIFNTKKKHNMSNEIVNSKISLPKSDNSLSQFFNYLADLKNKKIDLYKILKINNKSEDLFKNSLQIIASMSFINCNLVGMETKELVKKNMNYIENKNLSKKDCRKISNRILNL